MAFSKHVTKAQRNAVAYDTRGNPISIVSRQHTGRPGYNPSPKALRQTAKSRPDVVPTVPQPAKTPTKKIKLPTLKPQEKGTP